MKSTSTAKSSARNRAFGVVRDINYYLKLQGVDAKAEVPFQGRGIIISGYGVKKRYEPKLATKLLSEIDRQDLRQIPFGSFMGTINAASYVGKPCSRNLPGVVAIINRNLKGLGFSEIEAYATLGRVHLTTNRGTLFLGEYDARRLMRLSDPKSRIWRGYDKFNPHRIWGILKVAEIVEAV